MYWLQNVTNFMKPKHDYCNNQDNKFREYSKVVNIQNCYHAFNIDNLFITVVIEYLRSTAIQINFKIVSQS